MKALSAPTNQDTINIYSIYGVSRDRQSIDPHPDFPNPRTDIGALQQLAEGIYNSGTIDTPIAVWEREPGQYILLNGYRRVTAVLRFNLLITLFDENIPVKFWQPNDNLLTNGISAEQQAKAFMIRVNSKNLQSGQKYLSFEDEVAAVRRLKNDGMSNEQIATLLHFSRETARLMANENLTQETIGAVGETVTEQTPFGKSQALAIGKLPQEEQKKLIQKAKTAVKECRDKGKKPTTKAVSIRIGRTVHDPVERKPAPKEKTTTQISDNRVLNKSVDLLKKLRQCLDEARNGNTAEIMNFGAILSKIDMAIELSNQLFEELTKGNQ